MPYTKIQLSSAIEKFIPFEVRTFLGIAQSLDEAAILLFLYDTPYKDEVVIIREALTDLRENGMLLYSERVECII